MKRSQRVWTGPWRSLFGVGAVVVVVAGATSAGERRQPRAQPEQQQAQQRPQRPQMRQPLLDPAGHVLDEKFIRTPLLRGDEKYADIDGSKTKDILREVTAISLKTRDDKTRYWGRIAGTSGEAMTADWVEAKFRTYGLKEVHRNQFPLPPQWFPTDWAISFDGAGKSYTFKSLLPASRSKPTPKTGLDVDAIWVGTGTAADFAGRDVKGKAVLIHSIPAPGAMGHSAGYEGAIARAQEKGAAAVGVVYGISSNFAIWNPLTGGGGPTTSITIPGFFMGWEDGKVIRELLGKGQPVRLKMRLNVEQRAGLKSQSVYGTLPGTTDEEIIVMAHMDGYFQAALDNASGLAVMMTLLDHFSKVPQAQRRRNIRFIGQAGHHAGSFGSHWLHDHRATELAKTALAINCEHISVPDHKYWNGDLRVSTGIAPRRWWVNGSEKVFDIALKAYQTFNIAIIGDMDPRSSGEMGSISLDVPSLQLIRSPVTKHTEQDTPEWVPAVGLEQTGRAYAKIIDEINKLDRREILPTSKATDSQ